MPASWRTDSSGTGGGAIAGDGEAIGVTVRQRDSTQRHIVGHLLPAQGLGVPCAPGINDRRVTHNMCCVQVPEANRRPRRAGTSTVAGDVPSCQPRERSRFKISPGHFVSRHCRASAVPIFLTPRRQSVGRGLRRDGDMGALGRPARSLPPWCQTNLFFAVRPASFGSAALWNGACAVED
jgi:hypothetical protein